MTPASQPGTAAQPQPCDVFVIGGGPGGATMAALLARQGRDVVLVDKARHPRFHIGESLLPANVPMFDDLGVRQRIEAIGMPKWGVEFCSEEHARSSFFDFADAWDASMPMAWQVRRSAFDQILFGRAAELGARTLEGCKVTRVAFDADGADVEARLDDGTARRWRAKFVVDASGRDTLLANQFGLKRKNKRHNSAALFGHFRDARRLQGKAEGNITVFWFRHGWFWFIPLADGSTSVGAVCWPHYLKSRQQPLKEFFLQTIAMSPALAQRLEGATLIDDAVYATGNYSYGSAQASGERWMLVGDAYAFIDPVFSSGVYLAMANAYAGAPLVAARLDRPAEAAAAARSYLRHALRGPRAFSWFIFRMTNPMMRHLFMNGEDPPLRMKAAVLSVLAGDIYGGSPIGPSLGAFRFVYYVGSLLTPRRTFAAWRARRRNVRDVGATKGENVVSAAR